MTGDEWTEAYDPEGSRSAQAHQTAPAQTPEPTPSGWSRIAVIVVALAVAVAIPRLVDSHLVVGASTPNQGLRSPTGKLTSVDGSIPQMPLPSRVLPPSADTSSWYCAGSTDVPDGLSGQTSLLAVNTSDGSRILNVSSVNDAGATKDVQLDLAARAQLLVSGVDLVSGNYVAVSVLARGGGVAVSELASGPSGRSVTPCSSITSPSWYFAAATGQQGSRVLYFLFNPLDSQSVVDLTLIGPNGPFGTGDEQGIVVSPHSLVVVDPNTYFFGIEGIGVEAIARTGQIAAFELQMEPPTLAAGSSASLNESAGSGAVAAVAGQQSTASEWLFPQGAASPLQAESLDLLNPGPTTAQVQVSATLDSNTAAPLDLTVPPESDTVFHVGDQVRIPQNDGQAIFVRVMNGSPIAAFQWVGSPDQGGQVPQGAWLSLVSGMDAASTEWVVSASSTWAQVGATVVVQNPTSRTESVEFLALGRPDGGPGSRETVITGKIPPKGHLVEAIPAGLVGEAPLVVTSQHPVVVEQELEATGFTGYTAAAAIPME